MSKAIATILKEEGFIEDFEIYDLSKKKTFRIKELKSQLANV